MATCHKEAVAVGDAEALLVGQEIRRAPAVVVLEVLPFFAKSMALPCHIAAGICSLPQLMARVEAVEMIEGIRVECVREALEDARRCGAADKERLDAVEVLP